jgi:hypothetical protein
MKNAAFHGIMIYGNRRLLPAGWMHRILSCIGKGNRRI